MPFLSSKAQNLFNRSGTADFFITYVLYIPVGFSNDFLKKAANSVFNLAALFAAISTVERAVVL